MSVFQLGDGSNPYTARLPDDAGEVAIDSEGDPDDFDEAADFLGNLDAETLAQALLMDPGEIEVPQAELPLSHSTAPHASSASSPPSAPSLPFNAVAATERLTPHFTNDSCPLSIGGPYWAAELAWKRTAKPGQERKANREDGDEETERTRKRIAAWRRYNETTLERRLRGQV